MFDDEWNIPSEKEDFHTSHHIWRNRNELLYKNIFCCCRNLLRFRLFFNFIFFHLWIELKIKKYAMWLSNEYYLKKRRKKIIIKNNLKKKVIFSTRKYFCVVFLFYSLILIIIIICLCIYFFIRTPHKFQLKFRSLAWNLVLGLKIYNLSQFCQFVENQCRSL